MARLDTTNGPSAGSSLKRLVCDTTVTFCNRIYHNKLAAIVSTGSLARNEATFVKDGEGIRLRGDAEFILVFEPRAALPSEGDLVVIQQKIADRLRGLGLQASITLATVHPKYLRRLGPSIFAYELLACGAVVWGDPSILSLIPRFRASQIPREDAWHLLCNRLIEHLDVVERHGDPAPPTTADTQYKTIKLCLDTATSYLVFVGHYAPTYAWRFDMLQTLARHVDAASAPFPLRRFCADVAACTRMKLAPDESERTDDAELRRRGLDYARRLWRWELAQLAAAPPELEERRLIEQWMRSQPVHRRLRGWLYVLRRQGWLRSYQAWPHWMRLARHTSPRHAVYMVGCLLSFRGSAHVPDAADDPVALPDWDALRQQLPLSTEPEPLDDSAWQQLAADVAFNYSRFLVGTRS